MGKEEWRWGGRVDSEDQQEYKKFFHKNGTEGEEGSPAPPKANAKALKVKKVVLKDVHNHKK